MLLQDEYYSTGHHKLQLLRDTGLPLHVLPSTQKPTVITPISSTMELLLPLERESEFCVQLCWKSNRVELLLTQKPVCPKANRDNSEVLYFSINKQQYFCTAFNQPRVMVIATEHAQTLDNVCEVSTHLQFCRKKAQALQQLTIHFPCTKVTLIILERNDKQFFSNTLLIIYTLFLTSQTLKPCKPTYLNTHRLHTQNSRVHLNDDLMLKVANIIKKSISSLSVIFQNS